MSDRPPARFRLDPRGAAAPLPHVWEHTVGSGRALLALRADWQEQLRRAHEELGFRRVRFHGLLSDDMGTLVQPRGATVFSFHNADVVYDALLEMGVRPFVELSFMPTAIASGERTVFAYRANVTPPSDMRDWQDLIRRLAEHWIERYGRDEIRRWHFEVWNEPNLEEFWTGTRSDYFTLYRSTARVLKEADPDLRVGGPATAQNGWIPEFLEFCRKHDVPADFVSTHHYPTDALGGEGEDAETRLARAARGTLREQAAVARRQAGDRPLYYTEWNTSSDSRDPLHDAPWAAAFVAKAALEASEFVDGYAFWTFSDIFEETYFPSVPFHGGFGLMSIHGIPKPTYRAFELLHALGEERLELEGTHPTVDAWATRRGAALVLLLANHALPRQPIEPESVRIEIEGARHLERAVLRRVDDTHANAVAAWRLMGAPEYPSPGQVEELIEASRLIDEPVDVERLEDGLAVTVDMPPHAVALVTLQGSGS
jgi:xylan 1,4-beta-xylosidase